MPCDVWRCGAGLPPSLLSLIVARHAPHSVALHRSAANTLLLASVLAILVAMPLAMRISCEPSSWRRLLFGLGRLSAGDLVLVVPAACAVVGAWLGIAGLALDWRVSWKVCRCCSVLTLFFLLFLAWFVFLFASLCLHKRVPWVSARRCVGSSLPHPVVCLPVCLPLCVSCQEWPVPCVIGAVAGYTAGCAVSFVASFAAGSGRRGKEL